MHKTRASSTTVILLFGMAVCHSCPATAQGIAVKRRQADDCYVARAAYGGDQAACLVALFKWSGSDARTVALEYQAREQRLADSLAMAERRRAEALVEAARLREEQRQDSIHKPVLPFLRRVVVAEIRFIRRNHRYGSLDELRISPAPGIAIDFKTTKGELGSATTWYAIAKGENGKTCEVVLTAGDASTLQWWCDGTLLQ